MESLNILHLSDLHIGNFRYENPVTLAIKIADTLIDQGRKVEVVVFSGDVFDGRSKSADKDRADAICFFKTLISQFILKEISENSFNEGSILFVPGNHDLIRNEGKEYERYDAFINEFYLSKLPLGRITVVDKYNFICDFSSKKIAILGFNSCKIQIDKVKEDELKWINEIDLSKFGNKADEIKDVIKSAKEKEKKWDDFGYIDPLEMDQARVRSH